MATSPLILNAAGTGQPVVASGSGDGTQPTPVTLALAEPGQITLSWTLSAPLSAASAMLTRVGALGALTTNGQGSVTVEVIETTTFLLTCFAPGSPTGTYAAEVTVTVPSPRGALVPPDVIGAWGHDTAVASGWSPTSNLAGLFLMGCAVSAAGRNQAAGGTHAHPIISERGQMLALKSGSHTHKFTSGYYNGTSNYWDSNHTQVFAGSLPSKFTTAGLHSHPSSYHLTSAPETSSTASPLPPYYVVQFAKKNPV